MKTRGGSKTSDQPNTVLDNRRLRLSAGPTSFCTDPQLMGKTTSNSLMATPPTAKPLKLRRDLQLYSC